MKTVMVFGTFDILHLGHIHLFREAREYGDRLVVVVGRDNNVEEIKNTKTFNNENERKEFLENIKLVDDVMLGDKFDPYKVIESVKPDVIALGYDQKVFVDKLEEKITEFGLNTRIVRIPPYREENFKSGKIKEFINF